MSRVEVGYLLKSQESHLRSMVENIEKQQAERLKIHAERLKIRAEKFEYQIKKLRDVAKERHEILVE